MVAADVSKEMAAQVYCSGTVPGRALLGVDGKVARLKYPDRELRRNVPVTPVPSKLMEAADWQDIEHGRWEFEDFIALGEARASLRLLELLAPFVSARRHKVASLEDNLTVCGAWSKGRSNSVPLNYLLRKRTAISVCIAVTFILPWIDTHQMPADELSRI